MNSHELEQAREDLESLENALKKSRIVPRDRNTLLKYLEYVKRYISTGNIGFGKYWLTPFGRYACRDYADAFRMMEHHRREMNRNADALLDKFCDFVRKHHIFPRLCS
jgi:hypothetical protein